MARTRVVVVGGGFAGLTAVRQLKRAEVDITLVDQNNYHLFQPLLYQVATGGLSPANVATPLRAILSKQQNVLVRMEVVTDFDLPNRKVIFKNDEIPFDWLIVATGSVKSYFGNDSWRKIAPGLKTVDEALKIRSHVLRCFELAELETSEERRNSLITFAIVGGGPTGVELAGALSELANHTLRGDFRLIDTSSSRIVLLQAESRLLASYDEELSDQAKQSLENLGVEVKLNAKVNKLERDRLSWTRNESNEELLADTILWGAGVKASPLGERLARSAEIELAKGGRVPVNQDLTVGCYNEVFVIGDLAYKEDTDGEPLPGIAPVAIQQGKHAAKQIIRRTRGLATDRFDYRDLGSMAVIGRSAAVAEIKGWKLHGIVAWLVWLFVHLISLVAFENRLLVFTQWAWNYATRNRSARIITPVDRNVDTPS